MMNGNAGVTEAGTSRINGTGSEADKQLVHQPEEAPLEAFGGYAVRGDGCNPSSSLLHGQCFGKPFSYGYLSCAALNQRPSPSYICQMHDPCILIYVSRLVLFSINYSTAFI